MTEHVEDAERLRRLQHLTDAALSHLRLEDLMGALLARTRDILEVDTCAVLLLDEDGRELVARAAVGIEEEVERGVRIPVGKGFAGRVAALLRPVILDDVDHADVLNPILREKGIKSMLGVPLLVEGEVLGVLHVGTLVPRAFNANDTELLLLVADRVALAIERARLYEAERAARTRVENIQAVTDAALAHLELDELLDELLERIREILHADTCVVFLLEAERNELVARAAAGIEDEVEAHLRIPLGEGLAGRVAAEGRAMSVEDANRDLLNPILRERGVRSLVGVPLMVGTDLIGVLHVGSRAARNFTRDDVELLQLVGDRVSLAIARARLHAELLALDRLRLNFVTIASHELRTPATSVYGVLATIVERGDELDEATRNKLLRVGYEQGTRLWRLLEQLLDLSRLDAEAIVVEPKPIVLRSVLQRIVSESVPEETDVSLDVPHDLAAVADPVVLDRVISNLVTNALRYGAPPIVVSAEQRDRHLRIAVHDAGPGVPEELRPRLFERFERGEDAGGSGLGLSIAEAYARAHGGTLVYTSAEKGARFELLITQR